MNGDFDRILDECIDRINSGESIDQCLKRYPEFADDLAPLLSTMGKFQVQGTFIPAKEAKIKGRARLHQVLATIREERNTRKTPWFQRLFAQPRLWAPAVATLLILFIGIGLASVLTDDDANNTTAVITPAETTTAPATVPTLVPTVTPTSPVATTPSISSEITPVVTHGISPTTTPGTTPETTPAISPAATPDSTPASTPSPTGPTVIASVGMLEFWVTDAPAYDISEVWVTISNIEVHRGENGGEGTGGMKGTDDANWETIIGDSRTFELLELRDVSAFLGSAELEAGHYTQIRMDVEEVIVITTDGKSHDANIPSGKLKLVSSFDIEAEKTTVLTMDIDAYESVKATGKGDYNFKPTVKISVVQRD